jgi:hypothetical protein
MEEERKADHMSMQRTQLSGTAPETAISYGSVERYETSIIVPAIRPGVTKVLKKHGIEVRAVPPRQNLIIFPNGTTRQEVYPRLKSAFFLIKLPDGYNDLRLIVTKNNYYLAFAHSPEEA